MANDDVMVDVRVRVTSSVYRALFAEAQRRRLDGAGELVAIMLHKQAVPRRSPKPATHRPITDELAASIIARVLDGGQSVNGLAKELGVTRGAIYYYTRPEKARRARALEAGS